MKYRDLVQFDPVESIVHLSISGALDAARELVASFVISDGMAKQLVDLVIPQLQFDEPRDNKSVFVVGNYGTGKSHLMCLLSAVCEHAELVSAVCDRRVAEAAGTIAGRFEVVRIEIGATKKPLRDIVFTEIQEAVAARGVDFVVPSMEEASNNKDIIVSLMSEFAETFPEKGLLVVVDELLDYLRGRHGSELVLDLNFLRELGEAARLTRFRFLAGVQESLFESPSFQFAADSLRRVKDRFEQLRIVREDVAYVVAERLLRKTPEQMGRIREHLQQFTPLYSSMAEQLDDFVRLFPVHPAYLEVFEKVYIAEKREVLKTISRLMAAMLDTDVPEHEPGLLSYDSYWLALRDNPSFRSIPDIREVIDKSLVLEGRVQNAYTRPQYRPMALRIIHALSVHRLTTGDISSPLGPTAEELRDDLCLWLPMPEADADFLRTTVETALKEIVRTVNGQFISFNPDNEQYYIDLKKDIDFDAKIEERASTLDPEHFDRYYFEVLARVMECEATYVAGHSIWEHQVEWREHRVTRPGYLFFGAPNERSTAQPPRDFYLYFPRIYEPTEYDEQQQPDEVFFVLDLKAVGAEVAEQFTGWLRAFAGARAMSDLAAANTKQVYQNKAAEYLQKLQRWLRENLSVACQVTYAGVTKPLPRWLEASGARSQLSVRDIVGAVASACLAPHFAQTMPKYPVFATLVTRDNLPQAAAEAVKWLCTQGKTKQGAEMLEALQLLQGDKLAPRSSQYALHVLDLLEAKGEGQVLNRSELLVTESSVEVEPDARLEPELLVVVLVALTHSGDLAISLAGQKYDAANLEDLAKVQIRDLTEFRFVQRPSSTPLAALQALFELLDLPPGLVRNPDTHDDAAKQLQAAVALQLDSVVKALQHVQSGLPIWGAQVLEGQAQDSAQAHLSAYKGFLQGLQPLNTGGRLRNFKPTVSEVEAQRPAQQALVRVAKLAELVAAIQPAATYLQLAGEVLAADDEWVGMARALQQEQLSKLRDPEQQGKSNLRSSVLSSLEGLRRQYVQRYLQLHREARLNAEEDGRKGRLTKDSRLAQLNALATIDFLPRAQLTGVQDLIGSLKTCFSLSDHDLQAEPVCRHCQYRPVQEPRPVSGQVVLANADQQLDRLVQAWAQMLCDNLSDPTVTPGLALLKPQDRSLIEGFVATRTLPDPVSEAFVAAVRSLFSGLERVPLTHDMLIEALARDGAACDLPELRKRFEQLIADLAKGKEPAKVRIVIE